MARTSEVLAEQLRSPGFRTVDGGYDQEAVRDHLTFAHGLVTRLERDVEEFQARAAQAEQEAARAEAQAPVPTLENDELLRVVFDGQRRADALLDAAEAEAARIRREADERIAHLQDDTDVARLRAVVAERAASVAALDDTIAAVDDDLRSAAAAVEACRRIVGDRLAAALQDLREPLALAGVTSSVSIGSTERT